MYYKTCSFFGHRNVVETEELKCKLTEVIEDLIVNHSVLIFLFGSRSDLDEICNLVVTELKKKYTERANELIGKKFIVFLKNKK